MLKIRLARTGRKKLAHYRVMAADSRAAATGKFVAQLGHYNPHSKELVLDDAKVQRFLDSGAQPSSRMVKLLEGYEGVKLPEWAKGNLVIKPERPREQPPAEEPAAAPASESAVDATPDSEVSEVTEPADESAAEPAAPEPTAAPNGAADEKNKSPTVEAEKTPKSESKNPTAKDKT